ncbi:prepilin-type N-terminal cleavage/methylation domain-containing protein [Glaciecola sp. SC05]|uniref:prepilin-type N-terminal cleavage/methylation domain-containing protein n=1 Tax=Glaciecola sp. SC05 TaxID=1987355 RepID=UPI003527AB54
MHNIRSRCGFTLIELIIVIVIIGIIAVVAAPRFIDISSDAKVASINAIASQMHATAALAQNKARVNGLRPVTSNPGSGQANYIVDFGFGSAEVDFRNLCPESVAELGSRLQMLDFIDISIDDKLQTRVNNQYTLVGYEVPASGTPTTQGCYVIYDSFGRPNCTITAVTVDC